MMTVARVLNANKAAEKILRKLKERLPADAAWTLDGNDGGEDYFTLTVFADINDVHPLRAAVKSYMATLLEEGLPLVLVFEDKDGIEDIPDGIEVHYLVDLN